jgi:hypothetical protein
MYNDMLENEETGDEWMMICVNGMKTVMKTDRK